MEFKLVLDITVNLNGVPSEEIEQNIYDTVTAIMSDGLVTGDSQATVIEYNPVVTFEEEEIKHPQNNCWFVSEWESGTQIKTPGVYNSETGEVYSLESADVKIGKWDSLDKEYILLTDENDEEVEIPVCQICHEYVLKSQMVPDNIGKGLHEELQCSNPNCDSNYKG
jgi:hypothetical protein